MQSQLTHSKLVSIVGTKNVVINPSNQVCHQISGRLFFGDNVAEDGQNLLCNVRNMLNWQCNDCRSNAVDYKPIYFSLLARTKSHIFLTRTSWLLPKNPMRSNSNR